MNSDTLCNPRVSQVPCKYAQYYYIGLCHQFYTVSTGFKCVSQTPSRSLCLCGSVSMVLLLDICRNSVSRSKTSEGVHGYGLHLLDVFSYRGWGRQRDSEVLHSMGRQFGTVCQLQQFVSESVQGAATDLSLRSWTITNTTRRCWDVLWSWRRL